MTSEPPERLIAIVRMQQQLLRQYFLEEHIVLACTVEQVTSLFKYIIEMFTILITIVCTR
jgi:hypothetical protein